MKRKIEKLYVCSAGTRRSVIRIETVRYFMPLDNTA
jgi:hypothetical protein